MKHEIFIFIKIHRRHEPAARVESLTPPLPLLRAPTRLLRICFCCGAELGTRNSELGTWNSGLLKIETLKVKVQKHLFVLQFAGIICGHARTQPLPPCSVQCHV